jgi:hypothetical protein
MRIMIVTPKIPYPPNEGARIRTFNIVKQLARRHEVVLFTFVDAEEELAYIDLLKQICTDVHHVRRSRSSLRRLVEIVLAPFRAEPYMVTAYTSRALPWLIAAYDGQVDVAQAEFPEAAQYIRALSCRKVLDEHNVESDILLRQSEHETSLVGKLFYYLQCRKMRRDETDICRSMDMIFATSGDDDHSRSASISFTDLSMSRHL